MITSSTKKAVLNQTCAGQVEAVAGSGFGTGRKFLVRLPADMPAGVAYLESQQGPFVGGACPALVMPAELAAALSLLDSTWAVVPLVPAPGLRVTRLA